MKTTNSRVLVIIVDHFVVDHDAVGDEEEDVAPGHSVHLGQSNIRMRLLFCTVIRRVL